MYPRVSKCEMSFRRERKSMSELLKMLLLIGLKDGLVIITAE